MAREELASHRINRTGDTEEIGTDTLSQCSTNRFPYLSPDCGLSPIISSDLPSVALAYATVPFITPAPAECVCYGTSRNVKMGWMEA
jgi:hypothetical protein